MYYDTTYIFSQIIETEICFGESLMQVTEHQGLLMILLNLTTNPSSTDISITAIIANGIATGEVKVIHDYVML